MPLFTSDSNVTISLPPVAFDPMVWTQTAKQLKLKYLAEHPDVAAELLRAGLLPMPQHCTSFGSNVSTVPDTKPQ